MLTALLAPDGSPPWIPMPNAASYLGFMSVVLVGGRRALIPAVGGAALVALVWWERPTNVIAGSLQVGGGVRTVDDARELAGAGVARVVMGSAAVANPGLVDDVAAVVPVAVNTAAVWPRKAFIKMPGLVTVSIGKPIPSQGRRADELMAQVEAWIEAEMQRLDPQAYAAPGALP